MPLIEKLFDQSITGLTKSLDLTKKRNDIISSNIANAETPMYRAVDLDFAGELNRAFEDKQNTLITTDAKHISTASIGSPHLVEDLSGVTKGDGNNVDIDIQMGQLAYNSGRYSSAATFLRRKISYIKNAIRDSR